MFPANTAFIYIYNHPDECKWDLFYSPNLPSFHNSSDLVFVNAKFCLILAHPDLSAYRVVLSWLRINDYIWNKEIA